MTGIVLIANLGSRDVGLTAGDANIIGEPRREGERLWQAYGQYQAQFQLPLLEKVMVDLIGQNQRPQVIHLIATDQSETSPKHQHSDTIYLAYIARRWLAEKYGYAYDAAWAEDDPRHDIHVSWIRREPHNYTQTYEFFTQWLPVIDADSNPDLTFYLQLSGGTPAMTSMLLLCGVNILGERARPVYVSPTEPSPYPLDIGQKLIARTVRNALLTAINAYAYQTATALIDENRDLLADFFPNIDELRAIAAYAAHRRNFAWGDAQQMVAQVTSDLRPSLMAVDEAIASRNYEGLLAEGIYNCEIAARTADLFSLVVRVAQFAEALPRYLCLQHGVRFQDKKGQERRDGEFLFEAWRSENEAVVAALEAKGVRLATMSTFALQRLVIEVAGKKWGKIMGQFDEVGKLRNRAVHGHRQITEELLLEAYVCSAKKRKKIEPDQATDLILQGMKQAWADVVGRPFATENPFDEINRLLLASLEALP